MAAKSINFKRIAFDMSSFIWTNLLQGTDPRGYAVEYGDKSIVVNTADYGYDKVLKAMLEVLSVTSLTPIHCLLVVEGMQSKSQRLLVYPDYKARSEKAPAQYEEFQKLQSKLIETWRTHGAIVLQQDHCEGDDTIAYLAANTESDLVIASNDGDLAILVGTNHYGAKIQQYRIHAFDVNPIAPAPRSLLTLYKSLVGDTSDAIRGVPKFGDGAWEKLVAAIGYEKMHKLLDCIKAGDSAEASGVLPEGEKFTSLVLDNWNEACASCYVATLHPEWVDTLNSPLQIRPGMPKAIKTTSDLHGYTATTSLITSRNFAQARPWILSQIMQSPWVALDIEAAPTAESAQWAEAMGKDEDYVDVLGAKTTGLSLTFGTNCEHTVYFSIDHAMTDNVPFFDVWGIVQEIRCETLIQNAMYELPVLYLASAGVHKDRSEYGFLPNVRDTALEANYVDENNLVGLKWRSQHHLGYTQQTYEEVTTLTVPADPNNPDSCLKPFPGGRTVSVSDEFTTISYRMNELSAQHVLGYGADDTICTAALHNYYRLVMELEHSWRTFLQVEVDAAYMNAASYLDGVPFSVARMNQLVEKDRGLMEGAWATLSEYLREKQWEGTICPALHCASTPSEILAAYTTVCGLKLETRVRTPSKLLALMYVQHHETQNEKAWLFSEMFKLALETGDYSSVNQVIATHFVGEPVLNLGSPKQKIQLLYETMGFEIRVRNKATAAMKARGEKGSPKTDALALKYCMLEAKRRGDPQLTAVLEALQLYMSCMTKFNLFYNKYPGLLHWIDGRLHPSFRQSSTNTRRYGCAGPNFQQMPKHAKIEGQNAEFRECIVPHKKNAVVASLDFKAQELVSIAFQSQDENMLLCYGNVPPDQRRDMHIITGRRILELVEGVSWTYDEYVAHYKDKHDPEHKRAKLYRDLGKKVNFTTEYGAMAEKLSQTMLVELDVAQQFIDAKEGSFPRVDAWKDEVKAFAATYGYVTTLMGVRRHLRDALNSSDRYEASKAERQSVNFSVQSSCAEQTKLAIGRAWRRGILFRYDCRFYGPIHDETVWSCAQEQLELFLSEVHACMVGPYGGYNIPIESSISFGPDFGRQIEIGERPTPEAIKKGLIEMTETYGALQ
jgi:5'-3' exonuclease